MFHKKETSVIFLAIDAYFHRSQYIIGRDRLSLVFAREIVRTRRNVNNENTAGASKGRGRILADIGAAR